jgi:hypothetical protein
LVSKFSPFIETLPPVLGISPVKRDMVVVLPAPLCPNKLNDYNIIKGSKENIFKGGLITRKSVLHKVER